MNYYSKKLRKIAEPAGIEEIKLSPDDWINIIGGHNGLDSLLDICTYRELIKAGICVTFMGKTLRVDKNNPSIFRKYNVCG